MSSFSLFRRASLRCSSALVFLEAFFVVAADAVPSFSPPTNAPISWNQIGAKIGASYEGDGLAVTQTKSGARLHCLFQRLEGEATGEGLWLTSTVTNQAGDHFRLMAVAVGCGDSTRTLATTGAVTMADKRVQFTRPGLVEEYTVSMDGVRQDFVVLEKPDFNQSELRVELAVTGAQVEAAAHGATLVLPDSGRKIAYSRLRVTDATGKELPARIDVAAARQSAAIFPPHLSGALPILR